MTETTTPHTELQVAPPIELQPATFQDADCNHDATKRSIKDLAKRVIMRSCNSNNSCNQPATTPTKQLQLDPQKNAEKLQPEIDPLDGLPLLPDDYRFIEGMLCRIPFERQIETLSEYRRVWLDAAQQEPIEYRQDNAGRRAANLYLLRIHEHKP